MDVLKRTWIPLAGWIIGILLLGMIGSIITRPEIPIWYHDLNKPGFAPPTWIFGPVWTSLYLMMAIAAFLVWRLRDTDPNAEPAVMWFFIQLVLNVLWTPLFFGLHQPLIAFIDIVLLGIALTVTTVRFFQVSKPAGFLLMPYLMWITFAASLNFWFWRLN